MLVVFGLIADRAFTLAGLQPGADAAEIVGGCAVLLAAGLLLAVPVAFELLPGPARRPLPVREYDGTVPGIGRDTVRISLRSGNRCTLTCADGHLRLLDGDRELHYTVAFSAPYAVPPPVADGQVTELVWCQTTMRTRSAPGGGSTYSVRTLYLLDVRGRALAVLSGVTCSGTVALNFGKRTGVPTRAYRIACQSERERNAQDSMFPHDRRCITIS
jgi:hypothetical protein